MGGYILQAQLFLGYRKLFYLKDEARPRCNKASQDWLREQRTGLTMEPNAKTKQNAGTFREITK